jgi:hypothetical protein
MANQGLDNQWREILRAGTDNGETYTTGDLDKMVSEYGGRQDGDKAIVGLGTPAENSQEVVGRIGGVRRNGNSLEAKFSGIDPRVEHLAGRGAFPKTSIQVKRGPEGDSLQRVGLISPVWHGRSWHDNETPSLDDLMKQHVGTKDHIFKEGQMGSSNRGGMTHKYMVATQPFELSESGADAEIARLKAHGYWWEKCDQLGVSALFAECPHLIGQLSKTLRVMRDYDPTSTVLSECARYWANTHGVSFSEGLSQVTLPPSQWLSGTGFPESPQTKQQNRDADLANSKRALAGGLITQQMFDLAWKYANAGGISFKQAMTRVTGEHPEWVSALAQKQLDDMWKPSLG